MKMVSAAKLRKAQDKILRLRPYANKLHEILVGLSQSLAETEIENIFARTSKTEKILVVIVTSNKGLCGAFNSNVIREARRVVSDKYMDQFQKGNVTFLNVGKKGFDYMRKQKLNLLPERNNLLNDLSFDNASVIAEEIMNSFLSGDFDQVILVYNQF